LRHHRNIGISSQQQQQQKFGELHKRYGRSIIRQCRASLALASSPSDHLTISPSSPKKASSSRRLVSGQKNAHKSTLEFWNSSGNKAKKDGEFGSKFPVPPSQDGGKLTFYRQ